jgi:hypothetical protein
MNHRNSVKSSDLLSQLQNPEKDLLKLAISGGDVSAEAESEG